MIDWVGSSVGFDEFSDRSIAPPPAPSSPSKVEPVTARLVSWMSSAPPLLFALSLSNVDESTDMAPVPVANTAPPGALPEVSSESVEPVIVIVPESLSNSAPPGDVVLLEFSVLSEISIEPAFSRSSAPPPSLLALSDRMLPAIVTGPAGCPPSSSFRTPPAWSALLLVIESPLSVTLPAVMSATPPAPSWVTLPVITELVIDVELAAMSAYTHATFSFGRVIAKDAFVDR